MKELQDYIPVNQGKTHYAKIYYIEIIYIFQDSEESHIDTKLLYGTYGKAEKFKKQIESNKLPNGIKVKCVIHESMIEIDC